MKDPLQARGRLSAWVLSVLLALGAVTKTALAAPPLALDSSRSKLWIEGDSTLHRFSAKAHHFEAAFASKDVADATLADLILKGYVSGLDLTVPVAALSSGESGLDKNMRTALKGKEAPMIIFKMRSYQVSGDPKASGGQTSYAIHAHGMLSIAGREHGVDLEAVCVVNGGLARLTGNYPLLMSDYGIKPPTFMLGALKVKDRVVVRYDLVLKSGG
jgi:hypothetical protein